MKYLVAILSLVALMSFACTAGSPEAKIASQYHQVITVTQLKSMLDNNDFLLVNVHIPYAGEIKGTDLFVPYNEIEQNLAKLPANKSAKIVVYCRSGAMSNTAAKTLSGLGYKNILDVQGGMIAWENEGYPLLQTPK